MSMSGPWHRCIDLRSLWLFRIGLGLFFCYDVLARLVPAPVSIAWYTDPGYLHPSDSPHGNVIHRYWFARTGLLVQYLLFGSTFILSLSLALGKLQKTYLQILLWVLVVSMQNRCMHVHDGSDNFSRQLLLWFLLQPTAVHHQLHQFHFKRLGCCYISNLAVTGLLLQTTLMYLGTVAARTIDVQLRCEDWLPPQWSAVWFIVRDSFAIRDNWILDVLRSLDWRWTQCITASTMVVESSVILWFLAPSSSRVRVIGFFLFFLLHFGLLLTTRLINWQLVGMLTSILWIPSTVWDSLLWKMTRSRVSSYKKSDEPKYGQTTHKNDYIVKSIVQAQGRLSRRLLTRFFFFYMIYNFAGERHWLSKLDDGDIGEFLRISQHWVMYSTAPKRSYVTTIVGYNENRTRYMDVMDGVRNGRWTWSSQSSPSKDSSSLTTFVSSRWERALDKVAANHDKRVASFFLQHLCDLMPSSERTILTELEVTWMYYNINPMGQEGRWRADGSDKFTVKCPSLIFSEKN